MTISSEVSQNKYTGTGSVDTYPYTFKIIEETHLEVLKYDLNEVVSTLILNTDYTVTDVGETAGGNVVLTDDLESGYKLVITREVPVLQLTDFENQGPFFAQTNENTYDYSRIVDQQLQEQLDRCIKLSKGSDETPEDLDENIAEELAKMQGYVDDCEAYANSLVMNTWEEIASPGQATIHVVGFTLALSTNNIAVYVDGEKVRTSDITRTSDYILTLSSPLAGGEELELRSASFSITATGDAAASAAAAAISATDAAESAASINLPTQAVGDTDKILRVNRALDGYTLIKRYVDVNNYDSFEHCITTLGASEETILINDSTPVTATVVVPKNIFLLFRRGGKLAIGASADITISGGFNLVDWQVFEVASGGVLQGAPSVEYLRPEMFGAIPDGATECEDAFNLAFDSFDKPKVLMSRGTYILDDRISIVKSGSVLAGQGRYVSTLKLKDSSSLSASETIIYALEQNSFECRNFELDGNKSGNGGINYYGIGCRSDVKDKRGFIARSLYVHDVGGFHGIWALGITTYQILNNRVENCDGDNIVAQANCNNGIIRGNQTLGGEIGIELEGRIGDFSVPGNRYPCFYNIVEGNQCVGGEIGILVLNASLCTFSNNITRQNTQQGLYILGGNHILVNGHFSNNNTLDGVLVSNEVYNVGVSDITLLNVVSYQNGTDGIRCEDTATGQSFTYFYIKNCNIYANTGMGIKCVGLDEASVDNNAAHRNGDDGIHIDECTKYQVMGNSVHDSTAGSGIYLVDSDRMLLKNNHSYDNNQYGIEIGVGVTNTMIQTTRHELYNNAVAPYTSLSQIMFEGWGGAAPVAGSYAQGSRVFNTTPFNNGSNMVNSGWVSTVAGAPGTWKTMYTSAVTPAT